VTFFIPLQTFLSFILNYFLTACLSIRIILSFIDFVRWNGYPARFSAIDGFFFFI
jgi:hypothetical protein